MKHARISFLLASSTFFSACAYTPFYDGVAHRVSQDYTAIGQARQDFSRKLKR
jgi:hypothetical protein